MIEIKGNLVDLWLKGAFDVMIHGANCWCRMKSGIAGEIAQKIPGAVKADNTSKAGNINKLGTFTLWEHPNSQIIFNAYTQYNYGREPNQLYFSYDAFRKSLQAINQSLKPWELQPLVCFVVMMKVLRNS